MSKQVTRTIIGEKKNILAVGEFVAIPVKIDATAITADATGKKIVPLGSIIDKTGKVVNDGTAFGITYSEIDVTNGTEAVSTIIHGFIKESQLPVVPSDTAKSAMKQITIL